MGYIQKIMHPEFFQGDAKKEDYFEGWYFKHEDENIVFALIAGVSLAKEDSHAFIQLIFFSDTLHETKYFRYPLSSFFADSKTLHITIGKNEFSEKGIHVNISEQGVNFSCSIAFGAFTKLIKYPHRPGIMGLFSYLPKLQCNHGIVSLQHRVDGNGSFNGKRFSIINGRGYIEKDWGSSFPAKYLWLQCNNFNKQEASFMFSVATIPIFKSSLNGFICVFVLKNRQYVFATYNLSKIQKLLQYENEAQLILTKGALQLTVKALSKNTGALAAPFNGAMKRTIKESITCSIYLRLEKNGELLFEGEGINVGFEQEGILIP